MESPTATPELRVENYRFLQEHVYAQSGIVLEDGKDYLFENRLRPIVKELGLESINDLVALVRRNREMGVGRQVAEAMTTNETYFFRDPAHYEAIKTALLPKLISERADTRKLRFWSAASSTGQEAYSLAMLLLEAGLADWNIHILGTDFSAQVLERARAARYHQIEVNRGLPAPLLIKHFRRCGVDWQLSDQIRKMVRFESIDLRKSMRSLGPFDLVFCRNVMIYFDTPTKKAILKEIHGTLFRGGWLLLGGAETAPQGYEEWFERQAAGSTMIYNAR